MHFPFLIKDISLFILQQNNIELIVIIFQNYFDLFNLIMILIIDIQCVSHEIELLFSYRESGAEISSQLFPHFQSFYHNYYIIPAPLLHIFYSQIFINFSSSREDNCIL